MCTDFTHLDLHVYKGVPNMMTKEVDEKGTSEVPENSTDNNPINTDNKEVKSSAIQITLENEDWYEDIKSYQNNTLQLQRRHSDEFKSPKFYNNLSKSTAKLPFSGSSPSLFTPKNTVEKKVTTLRSQLVNIEDQLKTNQPVVKKSREELRLKIIPNTHKQITESKMDLSSSGEATERPNVTVTRATKKGPAPLPPTPSPSTPQPPKSFPKQFEATGISFSTSSLTAPFRKVQNSKSFKFLTDSPSIRKNFRGLKKAFKYEDSHSPDPYRHSSPDCSPSPTTYEPELVMPSLMCTLASPTLSSPLTAHEITPKNNTTKYAEIAELIVNLRDSIYTNDDDSSSSSDGDYENLVISDIAQQEIKAFEQLIEDYKREISQDSLEMENINK